MSIVKYKIMNKIKYIISLHGEIKLPITSCTLVEVWLILFYTGYINDKVKN